MPHPKGKIKLYLVKPGDSLVNFTFFLPTASLVSNNFELKGSFRWSLRMHSVVAHSSLPGPVDADNIVAKSLLHKHNLLSTILSVLNILSYLTFQSVRQRWIFISSTSAMSHLRLTEVKSFPQVCLTSKPVLSCYWASRSNFPVLGPIYCFIWASNI